jgi:Zn-dependent peptidase ImmA (M78 family)
LKKLAATYKRPAAALLLPKPPEEAPLLTDFRRLPGGSGRYSPEVRFAIRTARWLAAKAAELREKLQVAARVALSPLTLDDDPEVAGTARRESLGIGLDQQASFATPRQALKRWRAAVEAQDVLVFQCRMPVTAARGFSLVESAIPAIILNQTDAPAARIFTLFHEYAHLLLRRPGVCMPDIGRLTSLQPEESFCNRFAAALLLPRSDFEVRIPQTPSDQALRRLAGHYSVSRYVILGRLLSLDNISLAQYQETSQRWKAQDDMTKHSPQSGGGMTVAKRCLAERGEPFVSLVVKAARQEIITFSEANSFLGVKLRDFRVLAGAHK